MECAEIPISTSEISIVFMNVVTFTNDQFLDWKTTDLKKVEVLDEYGNRLLGNAYMLPKSEIRFSNTPNDQIVNANSTSLPKQSSSTQFIDVRVVDHADNKEEYGNSMQGSQQLLLEEELRRVRSSDIAVATVVSRKRKHASQFEPSTSKSFNSPGSIKN